jgi:uncharacterized phage protein gp47/JayE
VPISENTFYTTRDEFLANMITALQGSVSDAYVGEDGILYILFAIESGQLEQVSLANQLLLQECFPQTASFAALKMYGEMFSIPLHVGLPAIGNVTFTGIDGLVIPAGSQVGAARSFGLDPLLFATNADATVAAPGTPSAPTAAINVTAGNLNGSYEYAVTFVTASGETLQGADSAAVAPVNQQVNLTAIPIGGTGTTARKIYRQKNGTGSYQLVTTISNNTATTFTDNVADGSLGAAAPTVDTAHDVTVGATAVKIGAAGNVAGGAISILADVPAGTLAVTNSSAFTGGADDEDVESYRLRLMTEIGDPRTGSDSDLASWAEEIEGVEQATVFDNDNLGTATPGHVTVRIAGPGGGIPDGTVVANVLAALKAKDVANITIHVATFTPKVQNVTADVTTDSSHVLADVTPEVQAAVADYIDGIPVGGTLYVSGLVDAIFGLSGIVDVVVSVPSTNQTSLNTEKFQVGTVTVT